MNDEQWGILRPLVEATKASAFVLQAADEGGFRPNERGKLEHWIILRRLQKIHDADIKALDDKLDELGLT